MGKARNIADLLDANGDVKSASLDNVPASDDASALTTGTLPAARIAAGSIADAKLATGIDATKLTGTIASGRLSASNLGSGTIPIGRIADDAITNAKMADDAIDSAQIADGAVDLVHMSSESVDEDNLKISNAGSNGQFLSKQSGNTGGLTWASAAGDFAALTDTTVSTSDPAITTNPSAVGHIWFNKTTGNIFTCTRNTTDQNVWINSGQDNHYRYKATDYGIDVFNDSSCIFHMRMNGNDYAYGAAFDTYLNNSDGVSFTNNSMFGNTAARFTGAGEITVPFMSGVFTRSSNFSISMWIIEKGNIQDGYLPYSFNGNSSTNGRGSAVRNNNISRVSSTAPNTMSAALSAGFTVNDGDHFVVVGHSDATNRLYKNGSLVGTTGVATGGHSNVSNSAGGSIGGIGNVYNPTGVDGHEWWTCVVDDFRVFNKAISAAEAATLYAKGY